MIFIKSCLVLYLTTLITCHGYHHYNSKTDYANSKWRSKYPTARGYGNAKWNNNNNNKNNIRLMATTENPHRIRHGGYSSSRFGHLDGFMNRLDRYRYGTVATTTTTKRPKWENGRTISGSVESLWGESYDDTDYNDDELADLHDGDEEKLNADDEDYNDDDLDDSKDNVQAEEASNGESSYTATKWEQYGTMDKVHQSRKKHMESTSVIDSGTLAIEHFKKVTKAAECSTPVAKVLSIQKEYPNPGKTYMPHCTILHRCSEDTGCCHDPTKLCGPKDQTAVHLYFYVQYQKATKIERLTFANHTACGCIDKNQLNETKFSMDDLNSIEPPMNLVASRSDLRRCKCPTEYIPSSKHHSKCSCVCDKDSIDCDRMKKGKEYLSLKDRICIKNGQCTIPSCEYGDYLKEVGRCPKKQEK